MGRFPTCSSPVRHVCPRRDHVRLACIRHAASVNPEPGSNSPPIARLPFSTKATGLLFSLHACVITMRPVSPRRSPLRFDPDASVLHLRPPVLKSSAQHPAPGPGSPVPSPAHPTASGSQPVNVLGIFCITQKRPPRSEGRLIYHVSGTDVKGGLREIGTGIGSDSYETGAAWTPVAQESYLTIWPRKMQGIIRRLLPAWRNPCRPEWCFLKRRRCQPNRHRRAPSHLCQ